jgi:phage repressor protein C with HTH and peptisase S24 domain
MNTKEGFPRIRFGVDDESERLAMESLSYCTSVGERIKIARGAITRDEFSSMLGVHKNTLGKLERGETLPDAAVIKRICIIGKRTPAWLIGLDESQLEADDSTEFVMISEIGVTASMGDGAVVDAENEVGRFAFKRKWLNRRGLSSSGLRVVSARGDSMQPTVRSGDILLVDCASTEVKSDGIYLIEQAGELRCKRLQLMVDGSLRIRSDNAHYETEVIPSTQLDLLRVVAKVVWIGGER